MNNIYTEQDLDKLIASVEETLAKAEVLAKSSLRKDFPPQDDQEDAPPAAPAPEASAPDAAPAPDAAAAPAPDAGMDAAAPSPEDMPPEAAPSQEAAPEAAPDAGQEQAPQEGEQQLEGEQEAPLSDEELEQIYSSLPPEELERHYSIIRQHLDQAYQKAEEDESEEEEKEEKKDDDKDMEKSEKVASLEAKVAQQEKALENIAKAFEILAKPQRKAVTDIQYIRKSEAEQGAGKTDHSKEEIKAWHAKVGAGSLSKSEREQVNSYFLYDEGKEEIEKLINSKGGK